MRPLLLTLMGVQLAIVAVPAQTHACHTVKLCAQWGLNMTDNPVDDVGAPLQDFMTETTVPARNARVTIMFPPPEPARGTWLDADGCVEVETQYAYGVKLVLYADALVGQARNIRVRPYAVDKDFDPEHDQLDFDEAVFAECDLTGLAEDDEAICMADVADLNSMYAYAVEAIYRMDEQLGAELDGDSHHLSVIRWHQNRSQYAPLQDGILIRKTAASLKHVVAHEVGHWFARAWGIDFVSTLAEAYNYPAQDASCVPSIVMLGGNRHALRSSEFSADALEEGLAQFVATVAFNSHQSPSAYFQYYKVIDDEEYEGHDLVELPGFLDDDSLGGTTRWVDEKCPNDWDFPYTGSPTGTEVTSEIDWMRFFWAFFTDADNAPKPNLEDIFDLLAYATWDVGDVWGPLVDAVENHPIGQVSEHADRFEALNDDFGVFNDGS